MKKKFAAFAVAAALISSAGITSFAGTWELTGDNWKYQKDDGTYAQSGWQWVDNKCYYFDENGIMLSNTTTPDGETVDENGVRMKNGRIVIELYKGEWTVPTTIKAEAPTLQDTGLCSFVGKEESEIVAALGEKQPCYQINRYMFQSRPAAVFNISSTTNAGTLCFGIDAPFAAFFTCSGSDTITKSQLEEALGVKIDIGKALYEERWFASFVYNGYYFSIFSCSQEGEFSGDSLVSAIRSVRFEVQDGFYDSNGQWLSV